MNILAIDPSTTCTGYAKCCDGHIIDAGKISSPLKDYLSRLKAMREFLTDIFRDDSLDYIVIEMPAKSIHGRLDKARGLSIYGVAVGYIFALAEQYTTGKVVGVPVEEWTNKKPKRNRIAYAGMLFPKYEAKKDRGGDVADAICLANWYWQTWKIGQSAKAERIENAKGTKKST